MSLADLCPFAGLLNALSTAEDPVNGRGLLCYEGAMGVEHGEGAQ